MSIYFIAAVDDDVVKEKCTVLNLNYSCLRFLRCIRKSY